MQTAVPGIGPDPGSRGGAWPTAKAIPSSRGTVGVIEGTPSVGPTKGSGRNMPRDRPAAGHPRRAARRIPGAEIGRPECPPEPVLSVSFLDLPDKGRIMALRLNLTPKIQFG